MKNILTNIYLKAKTLSGNVTLSVNEIAQFIGGTVKGDGSVRVKDMTSPEFAEEGDITFAETPEALAEAEGTKASCILTTVEKGRYSKTVIRVEDIKKALTMMYNAMLELRPPAKGVVHPRAVVSEKADIGRDVTIGPNAVVEDNVSISANTVIGANVYIGADVIIGKGSVIHPGAVIYDRTRIGNNVIIHSGTVIGSDGFGYVPKDGKVYKVPQLGHVVIEDDVEIGANAAIDRGTFTTTVIGRGTKLDNLVQVAHNVKLGKNILIASQAGIAGSTTVGDNTMMGGNVGVADHVDIGRNVKVGAKAGVHGRVKDGQTIMGYPAIDAEDFKKLYLANAILVKHLKKLKKLLRGSGKEK